MSEAWCAPAGVPSPWGRGVVDAHGEAFQAAPPSGLPCESGSGRVSWAFTASEDLFSLFFLLVSMEKKSLLLTGVDRWRARALEANGHVQVARAANGGKPLATALFRTNLELKLKKLWGERRI